MKSWSSKQRWRQKPWCPGPVQGCHWRKKGWTLSGKEKKKSHCCIRSCNDFMQIQIWTNAFSTLLKTYIVTATVSRVNSSLRGSTCLHIQAIVIRVCFIYRFFHPLCWQKISQSSSHNWFITSRKWEAPFIDFIAEVKHWPEMDKYCNIF